MIIKSILCIALGGYIIWSIVGIVKDRINRKKVNKNEVQDEANKGDE